MRRLLFFILIVGLMFYSTVIFAQIPRIINYQGVLIGSNEQPVPEGEYKLTFSLYREDGTQLWTEVHDPVFIAGGTFHVRLGTNKPLDLPFNEQYFLGIKVGNDPELQPRMLLTSAAYSLNADNADKVGGIRASEIPAPNTLCPLGNDGKFPAAVLPSVATGNFIKKNEPDTSRATHSSPLLLISNLGTGDGINGRSIDGIGISGRSDKNDGIVGWTGASGKSGIFGYSTDGRGITGRSDNDDGVVGWTGTANKSGVFGHTSVSNGIGVHGLAGAAGAIGVYALNNVSGNYAKLGTDTHGIDSRGLARFVLPTGQINISTPGGWPGVIAFSQNGHRRDVIIWDNGISFEVSSSNAAPPAGNGITITENSNVGIGTTAPDAKLRVMGTVKCAILQLTGGSDIAEPFDVKKPDVVKSGMVMVIDPENPGKLKVSDKAYDSCVAGVISGAGGIMPAMLMSQSGSVADGEYPVALTGRVYCLVDASNSPIKPGDLLTTSDTPGYAMKVTDFSKAQGAILGKAMSSLEQGQGLVLILVTLQ